MSGYELANVRALRDGYSFNAALPEESTPTGRWVECMLERLDRPDLPNMTAIHVTAGERSTIGMVFAEGSTKGHLWYGGHFASSPEAAREFSYALAVAAELAAQFPSALQHRDDLTVEHKPGYDGLL